VSWRSQAGAIAMQGFIDGASMRRTLEDGYVALSGETACAACCMLRCTAAPCAMPCIGVHGAHGNDLALSYT